MRINGNSLMNADRYSKRMPIQPIIAPFAVSKDELTISVEAKNLHRHNRIEEQRELKMMNIKKRIEAGEYQINANELAKKITEYYTV